VSYWKAIGIRALKVPWARMKYRSTYRRVSVVGRSKRLSNDFFVVGCCWIAADGTSIEVKSLEAPRDFRFGGLK
jgi:hypothetical protein